MLVAILISFAVAVLTGLGVGGGGLFMLYLALLTDTPQLLAQGLNLLFFLFSGAASVCVHLTQRTLYPLLILLLTTSGLLGAFVGTMIASHVPAMLLRRIFGLMLIVTGVITLKKRPQADSKTKP